jgi:hypothetical protein
VLTVAKRKGNFPGMTEKRMLPVVLARPSANAGIAEASANVKTVAYSGQKMEVRFATQ